MEWPDWPDWILRTHASCPDAKSPSWAGMVRVDACPSWWQPMQSTLFICLSQSPRVMAAGISVLPPKASGGGIFIIVYQ